MAPAGGRSTANMATYRVWVGCPFAQLVNSYMILRYNAFRSTSYDRDRHFDFSQTRNKQELPLGLRIEAGMLLRWLADRPLTTCALHSDGRGCLTLW